MDIALWMVQALLAFALAAAGTPKAFGGKEKLAGNPRMAWSRDFPDSTIRAIGLAEIAAAIGLLVTPVLDVWLWSPVAAAAGVVALMAGAAMVHARHKESQAIVANAVFALLALFVLVGRIAVPLHP